MDCVFCDLIAADSAQWVAKEPTAVAFSPLPGSEIAPGHTLVVPRRHCDLGVLDVEPDSLAATTELVRRISRAMVDGLGATGVCVLNASGPGSGRSLDHLHFHVVPRYPGDGEDSLPWPVGKSAYRLEGDARALLAAVLSKG